MTKSSRKLPVPYASYLIYTIGTTWKPCLQAAFGDKVLPSQLLLYFGPNEHTIGQQYLDDPAVDETALKLSQYSCLAWLRRFPHWHLSVRFLPATPPPPGVAAQRAAALSQGKDPDIAVRDARTKVRLIYYCLHALE